FEELWFQAGAEEPERLSACDSVVIGLCWAERKCSALELLRPCRLVSASCVGKPGRCHQGARTCAEWAYVALREFATPTGKAGVARYSSIPAAKPEDGADAEPEVLLRLIGAELRQIQTR